MENRVAGPQVRAAKLVASWVLVGALAVPLVGCGGGPDEDLVRKLPCPRVMILDGADIVTIFRERGRDLTDVAYRAELNQVVTECEYDYGDGIIYYNVAFDGTAEIGPAAPSRTVNLKVFMAATETDSEVLRKSVMDVPVTFTGNDRQVRFVQTVEDSRLPYVEGIDGSAYEILIGFQLTRAQLAYNRRLDQGN